MSFFTILKEFYYLVLIDKGKRILFSAALKSPSWAWKNRILIFDMVFWNFGDGYNSSTGVFCVPSDGMYFIGVFTNQNLGLDIVLNDVTKVQLHAHSTEVPQFGMNVGSLILQKGDHVWVKPSQDKSYWTYKDSITLFFGFLI